MTELGRVTRSEMHEQPDVLTRLVSQHEISGLAPRPLAGVIVYARGSSYNASLYGRILLELATGRPVCLAAMSTTPRYHGSISLSGFLAIGVSQSGRTDEIVEALVEARHSGARTLAITNCGDSPLADTADLTLLLEAGDELAVPATKTMTATMAAFAMVAQWLGPVLTDTTQLGRVAAAVEHVLCDHETVKVLLEGLSSLETPLHLGAGLSYAAAREGALKMMETCAEPTLGFSPIEFAHGPKAVLSTPRVVVLYSGSEESDPMDAAILQLTRNSGSAVAVVGPDIAADSALSISSGRGLGLVEPIVATVRAQQIAVQYAVIRGLDPDHPEGLSKVTNPGRQCTVQTIGNSWGTCFDDIDDAAVGQRRWGQ